MSETEPLPNEQAGWHGLGDAIAAIEAEAIANERIRVAAEEAATDALFESPEVKAGISRWVADKEAKVAAEAIATYRRDLRAKVEALISPEVTSGPWTGHRVVVLAAVLRLIDEGGTDERPA